MTEGKEFRMTGKTKGSLRMTGREGHRMTGETDTGHSRSLVVNSSSRNWEHQSHPE